MRQLLLLLLLLLLLALALDARLVEVVVVAVVIVEPANFAAKLLKTHPLFFFQKITDRPSVFFFLLSFSFQSAGIHFPGYIDQHGTKFADLPVDPAAAWEALSDGGKAQMIAAIGFLEFHSELAKPHVMRGGTPGKINTLITPGLWDPVGFTKGMSEEKKAVQRTKEIANGRLAMLGMAGVLAAYNIPGSVPMQFLP